MNQDSERLAPLAPLDLELAERPDSDLNAVVALLERDAALATAVLRVASSAGYRGALAPTTLR